MNKDDNTVTVDNVVIKGHKGSDKYSGLAAGLPFTAPDDQDGEVTKKIVFTYKKDNSDQPTAAWA